MQENLRQEQGLVPPIGRRTFERHALCHIPSPSPAARVFTYKCMDLMQLINRCGSVNKGNWEREQAFCLTDELISPTRVDL